MFDSLPLGSFSSGAPPPPPPPAMGRAPPPPPLPSSGGGPSQFKVKELYTSKFARKFIKTILLKGRGHWT